MPVDTANTSIKLGIHKPKKDRVVAVGTQAVAADEMLIWAGSSVNVNLTQSIIGTFDVLFRYAKANLQTLPATGPTILHCALGASEKGVLVDGVPTASQCRLHIGADVISKQLSHYLDRTHKRLREAWLEER